MKKNSALQVRWNKSALRSLDAAIAYIARDSPQVSFKVLKRILDTLDKAAVNPLLNPPDPDKIPNDGTQRVCRVHRYKISYRITSDALLVTRFRHGSRQRRTF